MDLATITLRFVGKRPTPGDDKLSRAFADIINAAPQLDAGGLRDQLLAELGYVPGRVVTLIERSAVYVVNRPPLSTAPIVAAARDFYRQLVVALRDRLQQSTIVQAFIPPQWFTSLDAKLTAWDVRRPTAAPSPGSRLLHGLRR